MFRIVCPSCKATLKAKERPARDVVKCTRCSQPIRLPAAAPPPMPAAIVEGAVVDVPEASYCPSCNNEVAANVKVCKYCRHVFDATAIRDPERTARSVPAARDDEDRPRRRRRDRDYEDDEEFIERRPRVQLIEKTSKGWKAAMLVGVLMTVVGTFGTCLSCTGTAALLGKHGQAAGGPGDQSLAAGGGMVMGLFILLLIAGLITFIVARVGAWWNHG